jgi:hypothetical protein
MANFTVACQIGDETGHQCPLYNSFSWVSNNTVASLFMCPPHTSCLYKVMLLYLPTDIFNCTRKHIYNKHVIVLGDTFYISSINPTSVIGLHCARSTKYKQSANYVINNAAYNVMGRGAQIMGTRPHRQPNFVWWRLIFAGPQNGTFFTSFSGT